MSIPIRKRASAAIVRIRTDEHTAFHASVDCSSAAAALSFACTCGCLSLLPLHGLSSLHAAAGAPVAQPAAAVRAATARSAGRSGPGSNTDTGTPTLHVGVNEVSLIFTVTDKHGHYIANLGQNDFALLDDQKAPEQRELVSPANQPAAARGHRRRRQHLDPLPFPV